MNIVKVSKESDYITSYIKASKYEGKRKGLAQKRHQDK